MNHTHATNIDNERPVVLDHEEGKVYDNSGKRLGDIVDARELEVRMSALAASLMTGRPLDKDGRLVKMDLRPSDVYPDGTNAVFASVPEDFVADAIAPVVEVKHENGSWFGESTDDTISPVIPSGYASGAQVGQVNPALTATAYQCTPFGLACDIPTSTVANADFDPMAIGLRRIVEQLQLAREKRMQVLATTSAGWTSNNVSTIAAGAKWNGGASLDPLNDVFGRLDASALPITTLVIPEKLEQYFGTATRVVNFIMAGRAFPQIRIARAKWKVSGVPAYIWQNDVVLVREPETTEALSTFRTLRWLGAGPDGRAQGGFWVREYVLKDRGARGTRGVAVTHSDAEVFVSNKIGGLIAAAYQ